MSNKIRRDVVVVIADTHGGSRVGLNPPGVHVGDGTHLSLNKAGQWLWDSWTRFWDETYAFKPQGGGKRYLVCNGDVTDRPGHHGSTEFVTFDESIIKEIAIDTLRPQFRKADYGFMTCGSVSHVGPEAEDENEIARELGCQQDADNLRYARWHLSLKVQDTLMHFAHFTTMGNKDWTRANAVNGLAYETMTRYLTSGDRPPDFVFRSHVHRFADSGANFATRAIVTPAWQLKTSHIVRFAPTVLADIGGVIITITNGVPEVMVRRYFAQRSQPWSAENLIAPNKT